MLSSTLQQQWQKMSKDDMEQQADLDPSLQDTARQPDELTGLISKLIGEKDQIVSVAEAQQTDLKPDRYVTSSGHVSGSNYPLTFRFNFHTLHTF